MSLFPKRSHAHIQLKKKIKNRIFNKSVLCFKEALEATVYLGQLVSVSCQCVLGSLGPWVGPPFREHSGQRDSNQENGLGDRIQPFLSLFSHVQGRIVIVKNIRQSHEPLCRSRAWPLYLVLDVECTINPEIIQKKGRVIWIGLSFSQSHDPHMWILLVSPSLPPSVLWRNNSFSCSGWKPASNGWSCSATFRQDHTLDRNLSLILITLILYLTSSSITHVIVNNKMLDGAHRRLGVDDLWLITMFISIGHRWRYTLQRPPAPSWPLTQKSRLLSNSWLFPNHCGWQREFSFTVSYCKLLCSLSRYV